MNSEVPQGVGLVAHPVGVGMPQDAAIKFVDDRESEARRRFEGIKREMAARDVSASNTVRNDAGEI